MERTLRFREEVKPRALGRAWQRRRPGVLRSIPRRDRGLFAPRPRIRRTGHVSATRRFPVSQRGVGRSTSRTAVHPSTPLTRNPVRSAALRPSLSSRRTKFADISRASAIASASPRSSVASSSRTSAASWIACGWIHPSLKARCMSFAASACERNRRGVTRYEHRRRLAQAPGLRNAAGCLAGPPVPRRSLDSSQQVRPLFRERARALGIKRQGELDPQPLSNLSFRDAQPLAAPNPGYSRLSPYPTIPPLPS